MKKIKQFISLKLILLISLIIMIIVAGGIGFLYYQSQQSKMISGSLAEEEVRKVIEAVGKLIVLPQNEAPRVATVSDRSKLVGQPFFMNAQNGDKVLIYVQSKKAIIYRPSTNKIIEVATVNLDTQNQGIQSQRASSSAEVVNPTSRGQQEIVRVYIYNGTKTAGLAKSKQKELEQRIPNIEISGTGNATGDFSETVIIDLSSSNKSMADQIAKELSGKVKAMPEGESKPENTDILVILGAN